MHDEIYIKAITKETQRGTQGANNRHGGGGIICANCGGLHDFCKIDDN